MESAANFCLVLVTAPDIEIARKLVQGVLSARLAACGNIVPAVESHYWWEGIIETAPEVLILFKTTKAFLEQLESHIVGAHPYDTPEIIAVDLASGSGKYLAWIVSAQQ